MSILRLESHSLCQGDILMAYSVGNIKTFKGMEGAGFNAVLYRDGKKVAFVIDSGNGGECDFQWKDLESPKVDINITIDDGKPHTFKGTPEEKILYEYLETLPREPSEYFPEGHKTDPDIFVEKLLNKFESERWLKRSLRKKYLFQIGDKIGSEEYQTFKKQPNITREWVETYIKKTYPNKKYKLLGE